MSFSNISQILNQQMFQQKGLGQQITAALICEEFDKILLTKWGEKITKHVRALYFKDQILTVASLSSVASQEISFAEEEIMEKINQKFGSKLIHSIRYLS